MIGWEGDSFTDCTGRTDVDRASDEEERKGSVDVLWIRNWNSDSK